jgi:hypothetical protein
MTKVSRLQVLGKEKDGRVKLVDRRSLDNLTQSESIENVSIQNTGGCLKLLNYRPREKTIRLLEWRSELKCQRCLTDEAAKYRVFTQIIDMKVCAACADEARRLGINVEFLDSGEGKKRRRAFS